MNYQLELFMNFEDIIELDTISATSDRVNGLTKVRFDLKKEFTEIGSYLKDQCFCHTNSEPVIRFKYCNSDTYCSEYIIPEDCITFFNKHLVIELPYFKWLCLHTVQFGGMYG